jgi:uncharacterized cupin superfamily protein
MRIMSAARYGFAACELTDRLGANVLGATVYEMGAGQTCWPYHHHYGVEEWLYVVSGEPVPRAIRAGNGRLSREI